MDRITLNNNEYRIIYKDIDQKDLYFYEKNPRIKTAHKDEKNFSQIEIYNLLVATGNVKRLKKSIRENGGIIEPLLVRADNVVLEGNSRLAALRELSTEDKDKWKFARCMVLVDDIKDEDFYSLISQYHIVMKEKWSSYDKAAFLAKMVERGKSVDEIAKECSISTVFIRNHIKIYNYLKNSDIAQEHFNKAKMVISKGLGSFLHGYRSGESHDQFWNAVFYTKTGDSFVDFVNRMKYIYDAKGEQAVNDVIAHRKRLCDIEVEIVNEGGISVYKVFNNLTGIENLDIWSAVVKVKDDSVLCNVYKKLEELRNIVAFNLKAIEARMQNKEVFKEA